MTDHRPIGIFDSGVGGLTVWQEIVNQHPHESTLYLADGANCPYGPKPNAEIIDLSAKISRFLLARNCKMIVVACNTASAAALTYLRTEFSVPVVGIEPAIKPAALATQTGQVGVLATQATLQGSLFKTTSQTFAAGVTIHQQIAHDLVPLVEAGQLSGSIPETALQQYLAPMLAANIDQLVLGCTHYPFLTPLIKKLTNGNVTVHNPAAAVAKQVGRKLTQHDLAAATNSAATHHFFTTGDAHVLQTLLGVSGHPIAQEKIVRLAWQFGELIPVSHPQNTA